MKLQSCRACNGSLSLVLSLGEIPIVNYFPTKEEVDSVNKYPLDFCLCSKCQLAQLSFIISPKKLFVDQHYISGASSPLVNHLQELANFCIREFDINPQSKVLDIGCNDGSFLLQLKSKDIQTLGIDPSINASALAKEKDIPTVNDFFSSKKAADLLREYGKFDLIVATHTLANIVDLHDFIKGIKLLLAKKGVLVVEVGSLSAMLSRAQFDAIYHEHYSYFSFSPLQKLLASHGLEIFKAETNSFHGGSLRIFAAHKGKSIHKLEFTERIKESDFANFSSSVVNFKEEISSLFERMSAKTVGFGAPAKGVMLLNFCQLGKDKIPYIVDSTPHKQGRFLPGMNIPIFPEEYLKGEKIDSYMVLAWNYRDEIVKKIRKISKEESKVIVPFPKLEVINF